MLLGALQALLIPMALPTALSHANSVPWFIEFSLNYEMLIAADACTLLTILLQPPSALGEAKHYLAPLTKMSELIPD